MIPFHIISILLLSLLTLFTAQGFIMPRPAFILSQNSRYCRQSTPSPIEHIENALSDVYELVKPSVVNIDTYINQQVFYIPPPFIPTPESPQPPVAPPTTIKSSIFQFKLGQGTFLDSLTPHPSQKLLANFFSLLLQVQASFMMKKAMWLPITMLLPVPALRQ